MKKLPTGIQSITKILAKDEYVYVDKTHFIKQLIDSGSPHYFISRPRRFGKSLFVSTLEEIFRGNRELFKTCSIYHSDYAFNPHPVLHFDFSLIAHQSTKALKSGLKDVLEDIAKQYDVAISGSSLQSQLTRLIRGLSEKLGPVVVLVDEYDKPMISHLDDLEAARGNRDLLRDFFGTLKGLDAHIRFTFITGVSKFSQVSLFSGLNNLKDITMVDQYANMLGYTEDEIKQYFSAHINEIAKAKKSTYDQIQSEVRLWYNGYRFSKAASSVYNPFSTLNYMENGDLEAYWYSSGTPSFLINQMKQHPQSVIPLSGASALKSDLMDINELHHIDLTALMFQTGYLTIKDHNPSGLYQLDFPNEEVRQAFLGSLIRCFTDITPGKTKNYASILEGFHLNDFIEKLKTIFASFPYHLFVNAREATYQGMLIAILKGMGFAVFGEDLTNLGRIDLTLETPKLTYIFECKLDKNASAALSQIETNRYFEKYLHQNKNIALIGINFSSDERNISEWKGKLISPNGTAISSFEPIQSEGLIPST